LKDLSDDGIGCGKHLSAGDGAGNNPGPVISFLYCIQLLGDFIVERNSPNFLSPYFGNRPVFAVKTIL
jgi:hypothetical protein